MDVTVGRGFCLGEDSKQDNQPIGMINVDALYSPVKLVKYDVQNTRVGQMTDYDKLDFGNPYRWQNNSRRRVETICGDTSSPFRCI